MDFEVAQGKTIRLPAEFFSRSKPADPVDPRVSIVDPSSSTQVIEAEPVRDGVGLYHFDYAVSFDAPVGTWHAVWGGWIDGNKVSGDDPFEVLPGKPAVAPGENLVRETKDPPGRKASELQQGAEGYRRKPSRAPTRRSAAKKVWKRAQKRPSTHAGRKKRLQVVLGLAVVILAVAVALQLRPNPAAADRSFAMAEAAIEQGQPELARTHYRDILEEDPTNKFALFNLGMLAHRQGRAEEAEDFYRRSLDADPDFLAALFNQAILQEALGRNEEAAQTYRHILAKHPEDAASHFNYGILLITKLDDPERGAAEVQRGIELDPSLAERGSLEDSTAEDPVDSPQTSD